MPNLVRFAHNWNNGMVEDWVQENFYPGSDALRRNLYNWNNGMVEDWVQENFYPGSDALRRNLSFLLHHSTVPSFHYSLSEFAIGLINIYDVNRL